MGLSGAGKSSAGKAAADLAGIPFIDLDEQVVLKAGRSIPEIFAASGEPEFRDMETEATKLALEGPRSVIATGSGWIASARNRALLRSSGRIIYLRVGVQTAASRLGEGHGRPKLAGSATIEEILRQLEAERAPLYELADTTLETEGLTLQQVTVKLAGLIKAFREEK